MFRAKQSPVAKSNIKHLVNVILIILIIWRMTEEA